MIRIAAAGDVHFDKRSAGRLRPHVQKLGDSADLLLLAGDLTQMGRIEEAKALASDLQGAPVPVIAVLGNHDYHSDQNEQIEDLLEQAGVTMLEGKSVRFEVRDLKVGIVGIKGFGGGFVGACGSEFGEPEMKAFIRHTKAQAGFLRDGLSALEGEVDYRIVLLHYAPVPDTLHGEKHEIYPFLGSYLLGQAIDDAGADLIFHGHAHRGVERGMTAGGVPVRNVAQHVIRHVFNIYSLHHEHGLVSPSSGLGPFSHSRTALPHSEKTSMQK